MKVPKCQSAKVPKCQSAKVPKCQSAKVPKCQSAKVPKKIYTSQTVGQEFLSFILDSEFWILNSYFNHCFGSGAVSRSGRRTENVVPFPSMVANCTSPCK